MKPKGQEVNPNKPKGHEECSASTGICESPTFGRGYLDDYGYWEVPCYECARAFEEKAPDMGPCWPFEPVELTSCTKCGRVPGEHVKGCMDGKLCGCEECHPYWNCKGRL